MTELAAQARTAYRIRATDPDALASALQARGIASSTVGGSVELAGMAEAEAADLLAAVVAGGLRVVAFEPLGSSLESMYLAMTEERR